MSSEPFDKLAVGDGARFGEIAIDRDADVPLGVQLAWMLRYRIGDGQLTPGQRLPGLRDLAEAVGVNINTVRAVYQRLEQEGLIDSQQGSGTFVAATAGRPSVVGAIAATAAQQAHESGVDPRAVAAALYVAPTPSPGEPATGRRRLLRTQIAALERTLGEMQAAYPGVAPTFSAAERSPGPSLLGGEELEQVRALLVRRLSAVQLAIDAHEQEQAAGKRDPKASAARARDAVKPEKVAPETKRTPRRRTGTRPAPAGT